MAVYTDVTASAFCTLACWPSSGWAATGLSPSEEPRRFSSLLPVSTVDDHDVRGRFLHGTTVGIRHCVAFQDIVHGFFDGPRRLDGTGGVKTLLKRQPYGEVHVYKWSSMFQNDLLELTQYYHRSRISRRAGFYMQQE